MACVVKWMKVWNALLLAMVVVGCAQNRVLERRVSGDAAGFGKCHFGEGRVSVAQHVGFKCGVGKFNRGLIMQPTLSRDEMERGNKKCLALESRYIASVVGKLQRRLNSKPIDGVNECQMVLTPDVITTTSGRRSMAVEVALVSLRPGGHTRSAKIEAIASPFSSNESLVDSLVDGVVREAKNEFGAHGMVAADSAAQGHDLVDELKNSLNMDFEMPASWRVTSLPDGSVALNTSQSCGGRLFKVRGQDGLSAKNELRDWVSKKTLFASSYELLDQRSSVNPFQVRYELLESRERFPNADIVTVYVRFMPHDGQSVYMELGGSSKDRLACEDAANKLIASVRPK